MSASEHLSALAMARFLVPGTPPDELRRAEAHALTCDRCRAELAEARAAGDHFRTRLAPRTPPALAARRPRWWRTRTATWAFATAGGLAIAAASLLLFFGARTADERCGAGARPCLASKGAPILLVFAKRGDVVFQVHDGQALRPGDAIRFVVQPSAAAHVLIVSVDGAGRVTVYHPYGGDESAPLPALSTVEIPGSIILDETPGPERIYVFTSSAPIRAAGIVAELAALGARGGAAIRGAGSAIAAPEAVVSQTSLLVEKGPAP